APRAARTILPARANDGGLWRGQRRSRQLEYRRPRCRDIPAAIADDAAARVTCSRVFSRAGGDSVDDWISRPSGPGPIARREILNGPRLLFLHSANAIFMLAKSLRVGVR